MKKCKKFGFHDIVRQRQIPVVRWRVDGVDFPRYFQGFCELAWAWASSGTPSRDGSQIFILWKIIASAQTFLTFCLLLSNLAALVFEEEAGVTETVRNFPICVTTTADLCLLAENCHLHQRHGLVRWRSLTCFTKWWMYFKNSWKSGLFQKKIEPYFGFINFFLLPCRASTEILVILKTDKPENNRNLGRTFRIIL